MLVALRVIEFCLIVYLYFDVVAILYKKQYKNLSGGINKQQVLEEIGSIMKHQEPSESCRRCLEAPGILRKHQERTTSTLINKQTKYSDFEAKSRH